MKIIFQPEAKTISNREIAQNQADLLNTLLKIKQHILPTHQN